MKISSLYLEVEKKERRDLIRKINENTCTRCIKIRGIQDLVKKRREEKNAFNYMKTCNVLF